MAQHQPLKLLTLVVLTIIAAGGTLGADPPDPAGAAAPACAQGEELDAGVCYPKCSDGFKGEGPLCKQICPERTQDVGNHCLSGPAQFRKKVYERAAAKPSTQ